MIAASLGGVYYYAENKNVGTLYAQNKTISAAFSGSTDEFEAELDYSETGSAYGVVVGFDVQPTKEINIGLRYQWNSPLIMERKVNKSEFTKLPSAPPFAAVCII